MATAYHPSMRTRLLPIAALVLLPLLAASNPSVAGADSTSTLSHITGAPVSWVTFDPTDSARIVTDGWTSTNAGDSWSANDDSYLVAFDPTTPGVEYSALGTGINTAVGRSTNDNQSAGTISYQVPQSDGWIVGLDTTIDGRVFAATEFGGVVAAGPGGLHWASETSGLPDPASLTLQNRVTAFAAAPLDPDTAYVSYLGNPDTIYRRNDEAGNWVQVASVPNASDICQIAVSPSDPDLVFAAGNGLYRSTDGGQSWSRVNVQLGGQIPSPNGLCREVAFDPTNPSVVYANLAGGVARSTDGGVTFSAPVDVFEGEATGGIAVDPANPSRVFTTTDAGIFLSTDSGATWSPDNTGVDYPGFIQSVASDPDNPNIAYAGTIGGFWRTSDGGASWSYSESGLPPNTTWINSITIDPFDHSTLFIEARDEGYFVSHDQGLTWSPLAPFGAFWSAPVVVDPTNSQHLLIPYGLGVEDSTDGGQTFIAHDVCCFTQAEAEHQRFTAVAVNPADPQVVYAGGMGGVWRSTDGEQTWTHILDTGDGYATGPGWQTVILAVDPTDPSIIYWAPSSGTPLQVSHDGGETWQSAVGIIGQPQTLTLDPSTTPSTAYINDRITNYRSDDQGETWIPDWSTAGDATADALAGTTTVTGMTKPARQLYMGTSTVTRRTFIAATPSTTFRKANTSSGRRLISLRQNAIRFSLRCQDTWQAPCRGRLELRHHGVPIAKAKFTIQEKKTAGLTIAITRSAWKKLKRNSWSATAVILTHGDRMQTTDQRLLTLKRRPN